MMCDQGPHRGGGKLWRDSLQEKKIFRNVWVSTRSGPIRPGSSYKVYQLELRDRICVSIIIPPKSRLAEFIDFATQVWAIARVSALSPKIIFIFHLFNQDSDQNQLPTFLQLKIFGKSHSPRRSRPKDIWPDLISRLFFKKATCSSAFDLEISAA